MDLTSISLAKELLKKYSIYPSKRLGQNFLVDKNILRKIIEVSNLKAEDIVLEIGPGIGTLTLELAKKAKKVTAVEKDAKMCEILKETLKNCDNVEIIQGDILKVKSSKLKVKNSYKIVANLPYYIVSPVIRKFLECDNPPTEMILMVQKEVAQRICASPVRSSAKRSEGGQNRMNLLAVSVQFYAEPKIIDYVSKNSFWPRPKVDSAIIEISKIKNQKSKTQPALRMLFFKIVKAGFFQPRKILVNNLSKVLQLEKEKVQTWLLKNNIQPTQRAETLSIQDWLNLTKSFHFK